MCSLLPVWLALVSMAFDHDLFSVEHNTATPQLLSQQTLVRVQVHFDQHDLFQNLTQRYTSPQSVTTHASQNALVANMGITVPALPDQIEKKVPDLWQVVIPEGWLVDDRLVDISLEGESDQFLSAKAWVQQVVILEDQRQMVQGGVILRVRTENLSKIDNLNTFLVIELNE